MKTRNENWINYFMRKLAPTGNYGERRVDGEQCIVRFYGDGYALEVSGVNTRRNDPEINMYIWADFFNENDAKVILSLKEVIPENFMQSLEFLEKFVEHHKTDMSDDRTHMTIGLSPQMWHYTNVDKKTYELLMEAQKKALTKQPW